MTLPVERTRAVQNAEDFLMTLLFPKLTPNVPKKIREQARSVLRHYPHYLSLLKASEECPGEWGTPEDKETFTARYFKE